MELQYPEAREAIFMHKAIVGKFTQFVNQYPHYITMFMIILTKIVKSLLLVTMRQSEFGGRRLEH
jgi:hypothetical protein